MKDKEKIIEEYRKLLNEDPTFQKMIRNLGINYLSFNYIEINENQDKEDEYHKILKFLDDYALKYSNENNISKENIIIQFINYGKTELVFVLKEKDESKVTILVKQPAVLFGKIKQEAEYLKELQLKDNHVIAPIDYYENGEYELYVTPYLYQARCIASYDSWGMYIPEPYYRFEPFSTEQEKIVNCCMIAKLISLYNFEKQCGISCCKLGGGDFMLPKGWENVLPTIENTLPNLYLIAAREMIHCNFEEYITIIRNEFIQKTIDKNQDNYKINKRARVPMRIEDINSGIELGKKFINR